MTTAVDEWTELIRRADYWRRSPASAGGRVGHKEWMHFCVVTPDLHLFVNFSLMDQARTGEIEIPRLTMLARRPGGRWIGDVDRSDRAHLFGGDPSISWTNATLSFGEDGFFLEAGLARAALRAKLRFRPTSRPALTSSIPIGGGETMKWLVVPRLEATGRVEFEGEVVELASAPAYHDHDWGRFEWGGDFGWEWAIVLENRATRPWTIVLQRITDRARGLTLSEGVLLWRGAEHVRTFQGSRVAFDSAGRTRAAGCLRVPRVMRLASPGSSADLPSRLSVVADKAGDHVEVDLALHDVAQIAMPDDVGLGNTIVSETAATASVRGQVAGDTIDFEAPAIAEFNRNAA